MNRDTDQITHPTRHTTARPRAAGRGGGISGDLAHP